MNRTTKINPSFSTKRDSGEMSDQERFAENSFNNNDPY